MAFLYCFAEELMQRSPISPHEMKSFLREMRRTTSGTVTVSKLLASKFQSTSEAQAIHAFEVGMGALTNALLTVLMHSLLVLMHTHFNALLNYSFLLQYAFLMHFYMYRYLLFSEINFRY